MAKYLILWEVDQSRVPVDPKERGLLWSGMEDMVKKDIQEGKTSDWGCFVGELSGYAVSEQSEVALSNYLQPYVPHVRFTVRPVMSVEQVKEVAEALTK
jgi:hypothetical protein